MPWFKVDDRMHANTKPRGAGLAAMGLWTVAGSWSADQVQEGVVPRWFVDGWRAKRAAAQLVEVGLWHSSGHECARCPQPPEGAWIFHDWEHYQPSKAEVEREREANRERQRRFREKRQKARLKVVNDE